MAMTVDKLEQIAEEFLETNFGITLNAPISLGDLVTDVMGHLSYEVLKTGTGETIYWPHDIKISEDLANSDNDEYTEDVLKHELIHYALMLDRLPFEDDAPEFIATCKRLNVMVTRTTTAGYKYKCTGCNREFLQPQKGEDKRFSCDCKVPAEYVGMVIW